MQIGPLALLKLEKVATIKTLGNQNPNVLNKLYSVGFCPGRSIVVINRKNGVFITKIANENPFCVREDLANSIRIEAYSSDFYKNIQERNQEDSIIHTIKRFFKL